MESAFDIAADLDTPVSAYLKLTPFRPRFLLESVVGGERLARYSFVGFGEADEFRLVDDRCVINGETHPAPTSAAEFAAVLRTTLQRAPRPRPEIPGVPFWGGLVGSTGFEMNRRFDRAHRTKPASGLDAVYLAPKAVLVFDHLTRRAALLYDGAEAERASLRREVIAALRGPVPPRPSITPHTTATASLDRESFLSSVDTVKHYIRAGDVYQLVLSICFTGEADVPPFEVYRALRLLNPSPYMYFCDFGDLAVVGSSPEALVRLNGREASLRPIAGTRPRGSTSVEDMALERELLADPKENAEHIMLVDLARNDLGRVAVPGTIRVDPYRTVERYSHVMHIVSGVNGVLTPERDAFDLFAAAFPAGTVVGAPKIRALEIIEELEPHPRGIYAGTVGYFGHNGSMDQAIAIRTLVFRDGNYAYQAGAGIVADSVPEREHAEVLAKSAALEAALSLAEEGL